MKAAVLQRRGPDGVSWRDFPDPVPTAGESVLKVAASSVNRVDLYMRDNGGGITHTLPQVMGVEAAGEIVEAAPGSGLRPGMKAVLFSEAFCGQCRYCLAGDHRSARTSGSWASIAMAASPITSRCRAAASFRCPTVRIWWPQAP